MPTTAGLTTDTARVMAFWRLEEMSSPGESWKDAGFTGEGLSGPTSEGAENCAEGVD